MPRHTTELILYIDKRRFVRAEDSKTLNYEADIPSYIVEELKSAIRISFFI